MSGTRAIIAKQREINKLKDQLRRLNVGEDEEHGLHMLVNLNQQCKIVLQERGVAALERHYKELGMQMPREYKAGDVYESTLWSIMHIFGTACFMGPNPPFGLHMIVKELR